VAGARRATKAKLAATKGKLAATKSKPSATKSKSPINLFNGLARFAAKTFFLRPAPPLAPPE
jgi:hypothetical protein